MLLCANGTTRSCSCEKLSRAARTKATAFTSRDWPACRRKCWSARNRFLATHYHELTELAARLPRIKNFNVAGREWSDQLVFLRKIVEGGTDKSYGIHVAR